MYNEYRSVELLNSGAAVFTAYEHYKSDAVNFLTSMSGWDDTSNVEIETEPKLTGAGSYIISQRVAEREIEIEFSHLPTGSGDPKVLANTLRGLMMNFTPLDINRTYREGPSTIKRREVITGAKIIGVKVERVDQHTTITISLLTANPLKNVYLNGSASIDHTTL